MEQLKYAQEETQSLRDEILIRTSSEQTLIAEQDILKDQIIDKLKQKLKAVKKEWDESKEAHKQEKQDLNEKLNKLLELT